MAISRGQRYRQIVTVLIDEGFGTALDQLGLKASWIAKLRGTHDKSLDTLTPEFRTRQAIERLGPTFAKIGQLLSVRPDLIPESYAAELAKLQDEMEPFPFEQAKNEIESALGEPLGELFSEFSEVPAAAASIGQVHFAKLQDGKPVAVKVQRPDVHAIIDADLDILQTQARRIQGRTDIGRKYDVVGLVNEFARVLHDECDYIHEAENADRLRRLFENDTTVYFPKVCWERTTRTVLCMERVEGIPFNRLEELDEQGVDRQEIARRGITCYYEQIFIHGFYHADPHPGNLFAMPDGRVAFTDFGRAGDLSIRARGLVADLLIAIIDQNGQAAVDVLLDVSTGNADVDIAKLRDDVTALIDKYYDKKLHEVNSKELVVEVMSLVGRNGLVLSSDFAVLLTTLATLQALGSAIDPSFHFVESVQPFARQLVAEQTQPWTIAKNLIATMRSTMKALQGLPENANRALKHVADNDLRMAVRPTGFDPLMARVEQAVDRLAFALVVSAFVLGFSWLIAQTSIPWWVELIADFALVCAAGVGVWFFLSILFRRFRQRERD